MDLFIEAMKSIAAEVEEDPQTVLDAPHSTRVSRWMETAARASRSCAWKPKTIACAITGTLCSSDQVDASRETNRFRGLAMWFKS